MDKKELRFHLLAKKHEWGFYIKDDCLNSFMELLKEGFSMAIETYFKAPKKFAGDEFNEFQNKYFPNVIALYQAIKRQNGEVVEKKKTESNQLIQYGELFEAAKKSGSDNQITDFLKENIWSKCTEDLLVVCKRYHNRILNDNLLSNDQKGIHKNCVKIIESCMNELKNSKDEAIQYFYQQEELFIYDTLTSDQIDENIEKRVKNMLDLHAEDVFQEAFLDKLQHEYKIVGWVEVYLDKFLSHSDKENFEVMVTRIINSSLIGKIDDSYIGKAFMKMNDQQQERLLTSISDRKVYQILLKYYSERINKPDEVLNLLQQYMERYPESGEAIYNVVELAENGRSMINSLPDVIAKYVKKWLLNYNYYNRENEIASVIEALESVKKIDSLFFDFAFWKEMEKCNAFVRVIENIAFSIGFEKCFEMIEQNYMAAKAYRISGLASKWLQAANSLAINNEEAQEAYVFFISNLIDSNSELDERSKDILIRETIDFMLKQACNNKKLAELEKSKLSTVREEVIEEIIHRICAPLERLEKMVVAYSDPSMPNAKKMLFMRDLVGKVRIGLQLAGIMPVEEVDIWVKQSVIPYNPAKQECLEEIKAGELVTCLSIGMMNTEKSYYEKATVKKYVGEEKNGDNV